MVAPTPGDLIRRIRSWFMLLKVRHLRQRPQKTAASNQACQDEVTESRDSPVTASL